jgi:hypothetical protein
MTEMKKLTSKDLVKVLGEAVKDTGFREKLLKSPARTLKAKGYEASDRDVEFIKSLAGNGFETAPKKPKRKQDPIERAGDI